MAGLTKLKLPKAGGYDVDFVSENVPKQNITCSLCLLVLREPMQAVPCGHRFCKSCINLEKQRQGTEKLLCPNDRLEIQVFPDVGRAREILDFQVKCVNGGCAWNGELRSLEEHFKECLHMLVECVKKCSRKMILRKDMEQHLENECANRLIPCVFSTIGCPFKGKAKALEAHMRSSLAKHLLLQNERMLLLEKELQKEKDENANLRAKVAKSESAITGIKRKHTIDITKLNTSITQCSNHIVQLNAKNISLDLTSRCKRKCPFTFTFSKASLAMQNNKIAQVNSEPFEFLNGYRGRIFVTSNNTHATLPGKKFVAIHFQVMQGPDDDVLVWPISSAQISFHCTINNNLVFRLFRFDTEELKERFVKPEGGNGRSMCCTDFLDQSKELLIGKDHNISIDINIMLL